MYFCSAIPVHAVFIRELTTLTISLQIFLQVWPQPQKHFLFLMQSETLSLKFHCNLQNKNRMSICKQLLKFIKLQWKKVLHLLKFITGNFLQQKYLIFNIFLFF